MSDPAPTPTFTVNVEQQVDCVIIHCSGRLIRESGSVLRDEAKKVIAPGRRVVIDLTNVTHSDSTGLSVIIGIYVSSKSAGCRLELVNLGPNIRKLFSIANLLSLFEPLGNGTFRLP